MKKQILISLILLSSILTVDAQWNYYSGSGIVGAIYRSGNVGIGTTEPGYPLDVIGNIRSSASIIGSTLWTGDGSESNIRKLTSNTPLYFRKASGVIEMTINTDGNVGIGTIAPGSRLAIYGNDGINTQVFSIYTKQVGTSSYQQIARIDPTGSNSNDGFFQLLDNGIVKVNIAANNARGNDTYFNGGGNVGIGTNIPQDKLSIFSSSSVGQSISSTGGSSYLTIRGKDNTQASFISIETQSQRSSLTPDWGIGKLYNTNLTVWTSDGVTNTPRLVILPNGSIGIGCTPSSTTKLAVDGKINATEVVVTATVPSSDYVFEKDYKLKSLSEVEEFVNTNKHLPEVPSAAEFKEQGCNVGQMQDVLLKKVEELTLYVIEQNKKIEQQNKRIQELELQNKVINNQGN